MQNYNQTIRPVRYNPEVPLRRVEPRIGQRVDRGYPYGGYQVTRIEMGWMCFGVPIDKLDEWKLDR